MKVYIAGPMSGYPDFNFPAFNVMEEQLIMYGYVPVNPAKLHGHTNRPWEFYMKAAIKAMLECDAVYLLPGWAASKGASIEKTLAQELYIPCYVQLTSLLDEHPIAKQQELPL